MSSGRMYGWHGSTCFLYVTLYIFVCILDVICIAYIYLSISACVFCSSSVILRPAKSQRKFQKKKTKTKTHLRTDKIHSYICVIMT